MLEYGKQQTPWDLAPLLYRGGAATNVKVVRNKIAAGALGGPLSERVELVKGLHNCFTGDLVGGGSRFSANNKIGALRKLFEWADQFEGPLNIETAPRVYLAWTEHLLQLHRVEGRFSAESLYDTASLTATMLDRVLDRSSTLLYSTRIRKPRGKGRTSTGSADKQSLESSFSFGHFLTDVCNSLGYDATIGELPVKVALRSGEQLELWCRSSDPEKENPLSKLPRKQHQIDAINQNREFRNSDISISTRYTVVNLRIEAELLMFIAQTGLNLSQAHLMRMDQYHYTSHLDGYQVRAYKNRRQGEVLFEIFSNYKDWFERYIKWRNMWFPGDAEGLLFPLIRPGGRLVSAAPQFTAICRECAGIKMQVVRPRKLRGTRINWLLRQSLDPHQVAEIAQHTTETLIRVYAEPNPQIAMVEITRFHQQSDFVLQSPAPGSCANPQPSPVIGAPTNAPDPDCINAAGCLFCDNHRDIESQDHVWSLCSLRVLKSLELARYRPASSGVGTTEHPAMLAIERLSAKLRFFQECSEVSRLWVEEALARIAEEDYHPAWDGFIRLAEAKDGSAL
ncbi:site-specific integrase|uniref:site-specific integrase n=1 Tax=Pseudomonas sp. SbOxS1 TaxID=2723884 RepID=UPI0015D39155|nr:site-specific integrase [Pseudomonas sp. SbOxS1]NYU05637.1 site-specific integrase [Pseudomonas sp. SbOxS1]